MAFEVERHGKIVAIIEMVFTVLIGLGCLGGIITMIVMASVIHSVDPQPQPPVPTPNWPTTYKSSYEQRVTIGGYTTSTSTVDGRSIALGLAIGLSFLFLVVFLVSLILFIILWKGVNNKESGKCTGWYITQSIFCGLDILTFMFSFTAGFPIYAYLIKAAYYCYRIYSIHVIRSFANTFSGNSILN